MARTRHRICLLLLAVCLSHGRPAAAEQLPEEFLEADTDDRRALSLADGLFEAGNYQAASKQYREFLSRFPKTSQAIDAQMMYAECLYRLANAAGGTPAAVAKAFASAKDEFSRAERSIGRGDYLSAGAQFRLGEIEFNQGRYEASIEMMRRLQSEHPGGLLRGEARLVEAQALLALHRAPEAYRVLHAALADQPVYEDEPRMDLAYGIALFEVGNSSDSLKYLEKLDWPLAYLYAARDCLRLNKPLVAIERLRRILQLDPQGPYAELAQYLLAESFFTAKDFLSAISAYESFLRDYPRSAYRTGATYKIGLSQFEREDHLAARGSFQSVLQMAPSSEFAELSLYMTGESFLKEGRLKEANFAYADMASSYSSDLAGAAQFKQGWTHYKQGEFPAAETALRMMVAKHPAHPMVPAAQILLGDVLTRQERYEPAVRAYQQALDSLESSALPDALKTDLREACLALLNRANLLDKDYGSLVSGYQYVLKHVKPTANPWRAATYIYIAEGYFREGFYDQALALYREVLATFPVAPEAAFAEDGVAWCLFAKGDFAQAERERQKLAGYKGRPAVAPSKTVLAGPDAGEALFTFNEYESATARFNQKKFLEALDGYESFEKAHPEHPLSSEAALQSGWCYYRLEHYGQALKSWERVEGAYPGSPAAVKAAWATADTYFRAAQYDKAVATYQRILQSYPQDPSSGHARLRIAQSHYNAKDVLKAISDFEDLARESPDSKDAGMALDFLTQLLYLPGSKEEVLKALTRLADARPGTPLAAQARFRIARNLFETGDYAAAAQNLEGLIAGLSGKAELMDAEFTLAECYYNLKRYKDAAQAYERFVANYPGDGRFAGCLFHLGTSRFKLEEFAPAADAFSRLAKDFPSTNFAPVALFNSALAYRKLGRWEEAAAALKAYLKKFPEEAKNSNATAELAAIYEEQRQFPLLVEMLSGQRDALPADDQRRLELTHRLAEAYTGMEEEDKAVAEYKTVAASPLKSNPFRLSALAKLGEIYERREAWAEARRVYADLAASAVDRGLAEAARARAQAAAEKAGGPAPQPSSPPRKEVKNK